MTPSRVLLTIASSDDSTMAASRGLGLLGPPAARSRRGRPGPPRPASPASSRIGAALSSIGRSVPSRAIEDGVVRQPDDAALPQGPEGRVLDRLAGVLVDDVEDVRQGPAGGLGLGPAGQGLGHAVEERHPALGVGADDRVADAGERDPQPLALGCAAPRSARWRATRMACAFCRATERSRSLLVVVRPPSAAPEAARTRGRCRAPARGSSRTPCRGSSTCRRRTARTRSRRSCRAARPGCTRPPPGPGPGPPPASRPAGRSGRRRRRTPAGPASGGRG